MTRIGMRQSYLICRDKRRCLSSVVDRTRRRTSECPCHMATSLLRRHRQFLLGVGSAASLLTLGDFAAQHFYEKKDSLDKNRLGRSSDFVNCAMDGVRCSCCLCHWNRPRCAGTRVVHVPRSAHRPANLA